MNRSISRRHATKWGGGGETLTNMSRTSLYLIALLLDILFVKTQNLLTEEWNKNEVVNNAETILTVTEGQHRFKRSLVTFRI